VTQDERSDYEAWCLGSCFLQPIAGTLRPEPFSDQGRRILKAIKASIAKDGIADTGLTLQAIRQSSNGEVDQDSEYLVETLTGIPKSANVPWYLERLEADYRKREAATAARAAASAIEDGCPPGQALEHLDAARDALAATTEDLPDPLDIEKIMTGEQVEPVPWAVCGLFAQQDIVVIGGEGGTGKSILSLDLAIALATGQPFLEMLVPRPQSVLYLDEENPPHVVRRRIRQHLAGRNLENCPNLHYLNQSGLTYDTPEARAKISRLIDKYKAEWVFLDSYVRFRGGDENSNTDAAEFAAALKAERCRSKLGWVALTHLAKPSKDRPDAVHRIRGASDIVNSSDALITLEGDRATDRRTLTPQQRRTTTLAPLGIRWQESEDEQLAQLLSLGTDSKSGEEAVKRSLRLAESSGVLRADLKAIVAQQGYEDAEKAIQRILGKLVGSGTIRTRKDGRNVRVWLPEFFPDDQCPTS
jgi:AAA domain-containing protein